MPPPATQIVKYKPYPLWHYLRTSSAMLCYQTTRDGLLYHFSLFHSPFSRTNISPDPIHSLRDKYFRFFFKDEALIKSVMFWKGFLLDCRHCWVRIEWEEMDPLRDESPFVKKILKHIFPSSTSSTSSTSSLFRLVYMSQEFHYKFLWINQSVVMGM